MCFIIHIDSMCVHIMASPMQLTCAQVEAMCPSQRVSSVFIKVKGGRSRREQLILKLGAGRLCIRSDCSSIIVATSTTSPRYEHMTCPQCLGHNQNSPSRRRKTAAAAKPQAAGLAGFLIRYRRDHMETIRAVEEIYDELVYRPRSLAGFVINCTNCLGMTLTGQIPTRDTDVGVSVENVRP